MKYGVRHRYVNRSTFITAMGILSFLFGSSAKAQPASPSQGSADAGRGLRQMMLAMPPEKAGQKPTPDFPRVYGVLMDWPIGEQIATIFSSSTGAASFTQLLRSASSA